MRILIAALLLLVACSPAAPAPCASGLVRCGDACVDTTADAAHCGSCGVACGDAQSCNAGACICKGGQIACGTSCADPLTSTDHCGASGDCAGTRAGEACGAGLECRSGRCDCASGSIRCDGACVDPATSAAHCGASGDCGGDGAGTDCGSEATCQAGACTCTEPLAWCGGCVDPRSNKEHCGASLACEGGQVCADTEVCAGGACTCAADRLRCDGSCVDPLADERHCGATGSCQGGTACDLNATCEQGACVCAAGFVDCAGTCYDPRSSRTHCGATATCADPGEACESGELCDEGDCRSTDTTLLGLEVLPGQLTPPFSPEVLQYQVEAGTFTDVLTVRLAAAGRGARLSVNGMLVAGDVVVPFASLVRVEVAAARGATRTYEIAVVRPPVHYLKALDPGAYDRLGASVAISGDTLVAGAPFDDGPEIIQGSGSAYVFVRKDGVWTQEGYLREPIPGTSDSFGYQVAIAGDTIAVSAVQESGSARGVDGDPTGRNRQWSGAVFVFTRQDGVWSRTSYLKASNAGARDYFGSGLVMTDDTIAVGAPSEDSGASTVDGEQFDETAPGSGAVYVFRRAGSTWVQEAYLKTSHNHEAGFAGSALALWGDTLAVGSSSAFDGNEVFVFTRSGVAWTEEAVLTPPAPNNPAFGASLALWGDTLAVGANNEPSSATGIDGDFRDGRAQASGAVFVFVRGAEGWRQQAYIKASNTGELDAFGSVVALSGDTLAVGAWSEDGSATGVSENGLDDAAPDSGAVYLLRRRGGVWSQRAYVKASNTKSEDAFGTSLALRPDELLVVGAYVESGLDPLGEPVVQSGALYVY